MKIYNLPRSEDGIPIYGEKDIRGNDILIKFFHIDGMYSYCKAYELKDGYQGSKDIGNELGVIHLKNGLEIEKFKDGYKIKDGQ